MNVRRFSIRRCFVSAGPSERVAAWPRRAGVLVAAAVSFAIATWAPPAGAQVATANPVLFVTQVPIGAFGTSTAVFGNHLPGIQSAPRGGDLVLRYGDGTLRFLTAEAGYGSAGMQGANAIAVREPCVHWSGQKALFSMVVGAATQQYQVGSYRWQIYEVTGLGVGETATIRLVEGQPPYNNVSPIYATDGRILFVSDRPRGGEAHLHPLLDEYESAPIVSGIYSLDEATGEVVLLEHAPSGVTSLSLDSFGRVIFTKWDHLQRDQQGDAPSTAATYKAFTYASEAADAAKTTSLAGAEVFPEPRTQNDPAYSPVLSTHSFNHFFPWEMNEDGTGEETLNHVGRQEIGGSYTEGSFTADPNLTYHTPQSTHANTLYLAGSAGLHYLREDPTSPGDFLSAYTQEFGTAGGGTLMRISGAPSVNAEAMTLTAVTPTSSDALVPQQTGYFRNPLPMSDGQLLAAWTPATGYLQNQGTTAAPDWSYDYRIVELAPSGAFFAASQPLTSGIAKSISWWTPDALASFSGNLWELDPVEVVARPIPAPRQSVLPAIEAQVFADEGVDVEEFRQFLRDNELALIVSRDVTRRDRGDLQQPFNLAVPGGATTLADGGTVYEVAHLQIFQGDALRGYGELASPHPGRRLLARPMHGEGVSQAPGAPAGAVSVALDGSVAALVPARRALTWQLTDSEGEGVVRERNWVSFQAGEIRVCANCHGVNTEAQDGQGEPENEPQALRDLLAAWAGGSGGSGECTSGIALEKAVLSAKAAPLALSLRGAATLPPASIVDPAADGIAVAVSGLLDVEIPGGAAWKTKGSSWIYKNALGAVGGVRSIRIRDRSAKVDGRYDVRVKVASSPATLPSPDAVTATIGFGSAADCAAIAWNGPAGARPRCRGSAARLVCR